MPTTELIPKPLQREFADSIIKRANLDDLRILVATGAKINEQVTQGLMPIHFAVYYSYLEAAKFLLVRGCDVNSADNNGYTALHLASEHGYLDMMTLLLNHGAKTDYRIDEGEPFPRTTLCDEPLRLAIKNNHYDAARMLLEHGANPNAKYFFGAELNLVSVHDVEYLELLLTFGANPDSRDRSGHTMLMKACRIAQAMKSVLCLISHGADVNAMTDERHDYRTVLHYAVLSGSYDIVTLLLRQGASVNFSSGYQKPTPLDMAILKGDPVLVKILITAGADVNAYSPIIGSPLHVACADNIPNRLVILKILLETGADVNRIILSEDGTPLKSILGEYLSSNELIEERVIRLFLQYGSKVIFKSQFRDPSGILNYLGNLRDDELMMELLDAAESFDPPMIRRCSALSPTLKMVALELSRTPKPLKYQVRSYLRRLLGNQLPKVIQDLPRVLQSYLQYYSS